MKVPSYKELIVWNKGIQLVKLIYQLTSSFPQSEMYGLSSQMRRAGVSIPSNIAEGYMRQTRKEFRHFLSIAIGSAAELETQIIICHSLPFAEPQTLKKAEELNTEILKTLRTMLSRMPVESAQPMKVSRPER